MSKRISQKDKSHLYVALKIGQVNGVNTYTDTKCIDCQFCTFNGNRRLDYYGQDIYYNALAIMQYTPETKYIDDFSKIWHNVKPTDTTQDQAEYIVSGKSDVVNGLFNVYLRAEVPNYNTLWVADDSDVNIYSIQLNYNHQTKKAVISKDMFFPFGMANKYWYRQPASISDTNNRLNLYYTQEKEDCIELFFEEVQNAEN